MNGWINKRLGIAEMNANSQSLATKYFFLSSTLIAQLQIASTFLVLFLLDILTYVELGMLLAIQFGLTALLDYPTGALGDAIGHKKVLIIAYCFYAISIVFLLAGNSFIEFVPFAILTAIAASQESGALRSWFDNNYRITSEEFDNDRRIFGTFFGKMQANFFLISGVLFVIGGVIAAIYSRNALFVVQFCLILVALGLIILLMNNEDGAETVRPTFRAYLDRLAGGLHFVASSRGTLLFFLGLAVLGGTVIGIWGSLMLFPFYASYTGTDEYTGLLRAILFVTGVFWMYNGANFSRKFKNPHRGLFLSMFMGNFIFGAFLFSFYQVFPPTNSMDLISFVGVIVLFQFLGVWVALIGPLQSRLMLELVPDKYRNAVYSLIPTLNVLLGIPLVILGGFVLTQYGFSTGLFLITALFLLGVSIVGLGLYWLSRPKITDAPPIEEIEPTPQETPTQATG
ncbi:MAG: MFS transporter [Candidatus Hodarchaeales archaeon]|jgi:MFS family permease